jgi:CheY-like chemotaxis protein
MSLEARIGEQLPYLRRYGRALCGSQALGDRLVRSTLEAAIADPSLRQSLETGRVALFRAFTRQWQAARNESAMHETWPTGQHETGAQERLHAVTPLHRQALLLTTLEDFTQAEAAQILETDPQTIGQLVTQAIDEIDRETRTRVLVIEDEPLIAMQLEDLVEALGHQITAVASTRAKAREAARENPPGLVLADIQLADGSSGLDAVEDIHEICDVPVIFITAYPERLLTGERTEPTWLVTKPFQEAAVRAAISQALFFRTSSPPN